MWCGFSATEGMKTINAVRDTSATKEQKGGRKGEFALFGVGGVRNWGWHGTCTLFETCG